MISAALPHTELLESIKDHTGYTVLGNLTENLKRWATDAEKKLGYNTALVSKFVIYENDNVNFNGKDIWLPKDCWEFTTVYDGDCEMNNSDFWVTGDYLYFRKGKEPKSPMVIYEALTFDGFGWPLMSRNHKDAIVAYIVWMLYVPKAFQSGNRSERQLIKDYRQDWYDECDAAIGNDVTPGSDQEWRKLMSIWNGSMIELRLMDNCIIKESEYAQAAKKECVLREVEKTINVYHWQYPDTVSDIALAPTIGQTFLDTVSKKTLEQLVIGTTIPYDNIGRIAFAIQGIEENEYELFDVLNQSVDSVVFNKHYNSTLKLHIYISKEFYSHSNIFFKFKKR